MWYLFTYFLIVGTVLGNPALDTACKAVNVSGNDNVGLYKIRPAARGQSVRIEFYVKAASDVRLTISTSPNILNDPSLGIQENIIEIGLGINENKDSRIEVGKRTSLVRETPNILSDMEFRGYWVEVNRGERHLIRVGRLGDFTKFIETQMNIDDVPPGPIESAFYSLGSYSANQAQWRVECTNQKGCEDQGCDEVSVEGNKYTEYRSIQKFYRMRTFSRENTIRIEFYVKAESDAHLLISSNSHIMDFPFTGDEENVIEIGIGINGNTESRIRAGKKVTKRIESTPNILSDKEFRGFWVEADTCEPHSITVGHIGQLNGFMAAQMDMKDLLPGPLQYAYYFLGSHTTYKSQWKVDCLNRGYCVNQDEKEIQATALEAKSQAKLAVTTQKPLQEVSSNSQVSEELPKSTQSSTSDSLTQIQNTLKGIVESQKEIRETLDIIMREQKYQAQTLADIRRHQ